MLTIAVVDAPTARGAPKIGNRWQSEMSEVAARLASGLGLKAHLD
jgi:hypothetical protein